MVRGKNPLRSRVPGVPKSVSLGLGCKCGTHHLPVGHIMRAILHAAEDTVELRCEYMCICQA
jgi:hypothetical protein